MRQPHPFQAATFGRGLFCASAGTLLALVLASCAAPNASQPAGPPPAASPTIARSPNVIIGHVLAVDLPQLHAVVDVEPEPGSELPSSLAGVTLLSRTDALQTTARLAGTDLRRGRTLGVRILSGRPRVGDEVVWTRP